MKYDPKNAECMPSYSSEKQLMQNTKKKKTMMKDISNNTRHK